MSIEEFSQYAPEMHNLLGNNREKRHQAYNCLQKGYKFSKEQAFALIPNQRIERYISQVLVPEGPGSETKEVNICQVSDSTYSEETIKETAQRIMRDKLSERDIR